MQKWLYDVEVFPNFFCIALEEFNTNEKIFWEISQERNDIDAIVNWFKNYEDFLISFNGIHYDGLIIWYLVKNYWKLKSKNYLEITQELKKFSDLVISDEHYDQIKGYKYNHPWIDIDLFLYWSKMLRISKKISLKGLAVQMNYPVIQELPFHPDTKLTYKDLSVIRHYNSVHDITILRWLTEKKEEEIKLRSYINKEYNLPCWSLDAPKIASEILAADLANQWECSRKDITDMRHIKEDIYIKDILNGFNPNYELPIFQKLFNQVSESVNEFSEEIIFIHENTNIKLTYGIGGLHSVNKNEMYYEIDKQWIITSDVASLYPTLIENYNCIRFPEVLGKYVSVKKDRLTAKKEKNKVKDTFLKLILNSTSGLIDNQHSWLYYPEGALRMRLIGQLILTKLIEKAAINGFKVISANTDGIEVIVDRDKEDIYNSLVSEVEQQFSIIFESVKYRFIHYKTVNSYIALDEFGKIKQKNDFVYNPVLGDSVNELVVAKALEQYFVNNIQPEEVLNNPDNFGITIFDFCRSDKISKDYQVMWNNEVQQQLNRYYISKGKPYLYKVKKKGKKVTGRPENVLKGYGVQIFNNYEQKDWEDYQIDYNYYLKKIKQIILEIKNNNQLNVFE